MRWATGLSDTGPGQHLMCSRCPEAGRWVPGASQRKNNNKSKCLYNASCAPGSVGRGAGSSNPLDSFNSQECCAGPQPATGRRGRPSRNQGPRPGSNPDSATLSTGEAQPESPHLDQEGKGPVSCPRGRACRCRNPAPTPSTWPSLLQLDRNTHPSQRHTNRLAHARTHRHAHHQSIF